MLNLTHFPLELLKLIASELLTAENVLAFSQVCNKFHAAVHSDQIVWRALFLHLFELPASTQRKVVGTPYDWKSAFQQRYRILTRDINHLVFNNAEDAPPIEGEALEVIRNMILDAVPTRSSTSPTPMSKNLIFLKYTLPPSFLNPSGPTTNRPLLSLLRLLLNPIRPTPKQWQIPPMQHFAYSRRVSPADPLESIALYESMALLFSYHIKGKESSTFHQSSMLTPEELPGFWKGRLVRKMKNTAKSRCSRDVSVAHVDLHHLERNPEVLLNETADDFLTELKLTIHPPSKTSSRSPETTSSNKYSSQIITGEGKDYRSFTIPAGSIQHLPPIHGIPGWRSISFTKDYGAHHWTYEGIILPGSNLILGKWRHPHVPLNIITMQGIYCFWAVPKDTPDLGSRDNRIALRG